MRSSTLLAIIGLSVVAACDKHTPQAPSGENSEYKMSDDGRIKLVEALGQLAAEGPNIGPVTAISANSTTDAVVHEGAAIVPALVAALDHSSYSQTVWVVFCLTELRATSAKARVIKLKDEEEHGRFAAEPHDLTLTFEIKNYLRVVGEAEQEIGISRDLN
jgi:hypothetical protein